MIVSDEKHWSTETYWKPAKSLKDVPTLERLNVSCSIELRPAPPVSASLIQWIAVVILVGCLENLPWKQNILRASESRFCLVSGCLKLYFVLFTSLHYSRCLKARVSIIFQVFRLPHLNASFKCCRRCRNHCAEAPVERHRQLPRGNKERMLSYGETADQTKQNEIRKVILDQPKQLKTTSQTNCHHCP